MIDLTIPLDEHGKQPMYEQIYQHIRNEIQAAHIPAGERLPSTRKLSAHLGVSRSTVDLAYEQLLAEGYIVAVPYKGYYACEMDSLYQQPEPVKTTVVKKIKTEKSYDVDFAVNGIAKDGFPYQTWKKISKIVLAEDDGTLFQLGNPQGEESLRRQIAHYLYYARGVNCDLDQIIVGAGNDYLLMLLHLILGMDWKIAMDNPTYRSACLAFEKMGYEVCPLEPDEFGMNPRLLEESGANLAYVMPSHQFPLGSVMPIKRRQKLLSWAADGESSGESSGKTERFLIEDDYDSEFRYKGKPIPSLQGFDSQDHVIYLGTFSKSLAPAIRISYMVLPRRLLSCYRERAGNFSVTVSRVDQKILEEFLGGGYFERHLNRMRGSYRAKHDHLLREMRRLKGICRVTGENAGVHILVELTNGLSEKEAVGRAASVGVKVYGLSEYAIAPLKEYIRPTVVMGYATLSEEQIVEGIRRLEHIWK